MLLLQQQQLSASFYKSYTCVHSIKAAEAGGAQDCPICCIAYICVNVYAGVNVRACLCRRWAVYSTVLLLASRASFECASTFCWCGDGRTKIQVSYFSSNKRKKRLLYIFLIFQPIQLYRHPLTHPPPPKNSSAEPASVCVCCVCLRQQRRRPATAAKAYSAATPFLFFIFFPLSAVFQWGTAAMGCGPALLARLFWLEESQEALRHPPFNTLCLTVSRALSTVYASLFFYFLPIPAFLFPFFVISWKQLANNYWLSLLTGIMFFSLFRPVQGPHLLTCPVLPKKIKIKKK